MVAPRWLRSGVSLAAAQRTRWPARSAAYPCARSFRATGWEAALDRQENQAVHVQCRHDAGGQDGDAQHLAHHRQRDCQVFDLEVGRARHQAGLERVFRRAGRHRDWVVAVGAFPDRRHRLRRLALLHDEHHPVGEERLELKLGIGCHMLPTPSSTSPRRTASRMLHIFRPFQTYDLVLGALFPAESGQACPSGASLAVRRFPGRWHKLSKMRKKPKNF